MLMAVSELYLWALRRRRGAPMVHRQVLLALAVFASSSGVVQAQSTFPAPLPGDNPPASFPPANGETRAPGALPLPVPRQSECMNEFLPLRQEAERRGQLIRGASARHASAAEACKLLSEFVVAEVKLLNYVQVKSEVCGISSSILDQLNTGHKHTVEMQTRACNAASQKRWPEGIVTTDFGDPAFRDSSRFFKMAPEPPSKEGTWIGDPPHMR
jgi:hypothetical protein